MADPHWTGYVGMITGTIGSITGIAGSIMGYIGYKKSNELKALDLRIELKRAVTDISLDLVTLRNQMQEGNKSRRAVLNARGMFNSSIRENWDKEFGFDQKICESFTAELREIDCDFDELDHKSLESKLIETHHLHGRTKNLSDKYNSAMEQDNEQRRQLRNDMVSR